MSVATTSKTGQSVDLASSEKTEEFQNLDIVQNLNDLVDETSQNATQQDKQHLKHETDRRPEQIYFHQNNYQQQLLQQHLFQQQWQQQQVNGSMSKTGQSVGVLSEKTPEELPNNLDIMRHINNLLNSKEEVPNLDKTPQSVIHPALQGKQNVQESERRPEQLYYHPNNYQMQQQLLHQQWQQQINDTGSYQAQQLHQSQQVHQSSMQPLHQTHQSELQEVLKYANIGKESLAESNPGVIGYGHQKFTSTGNPAHFDRGLDSPTTPRRITPADRSMSPVYSPLTPISPASEQIVYQDFIPQSRKIEGSLPPSPPSDSNLSPVEKLVIHNLRTKHNVRQVESTASRHLPMTPPRSPTSMTGSTANDQALENLMAQLQMQDKTRMLHRRSPITARCHTYERDSHNGSTNYFAVSRTGPYDVVEKQARQNRNRAETSEASCTWSGQLPPRNHKSPVYSCKVFLGGVPWDITESGLQAAFNKYGHLKIEWPGKDGYVYLVFDMEKSVRSLLQSCTHDFSNGDYFYKISSRRMRSKEVQVIPWILADSNHTNPSTSTLQTQQRPDHSKTVFVGALHGMITAEALANIMQDLFGTVVCSGIDTDKHKYPIGSGRVTFQNRKNYMKAVQAAFVEIKTPKFTKKLQVDPYLGDSVCALCNSSQGNFFCRDLLCFKYLCQRCWYFQHNENHLSSHKPLSRNSKTSAM